MTSVVERPAHQLRDEALGEADESRTLGASQNDDDRRTMPQAVVEQLASQHVVLRFGTELSDVSRVAHGAHARARQPLELTDQLRRHHRVEQLLLAREILVEIANRRARSFGDIRHGGGRIAELREGAAGRCHERALDLGLPHLDHSKENLTLSFGARKVAARRLAQFQRLLPHPCRPVAPADAPTPLCKRATARQPPHRYASAVGSRFSGFCASSSGVKRA